MRFSATLSRLYYTVKPLKWQQVVYRVKARYFPPRSVKTFSNVASESWVWQGPEVIAPSLLSENEVCFLNLSADVSSATCWNAANYEKLWLYNLHYFDDLNAHNSSERKAWQLNLLKRWIAENPVMVGNGWEPYPLSLRLVNIVKWYNRVGVTEQLVLDSVAQQAEALIKQLEYHILGNHLFANAKALVFVGSFIKGPYANKYLAKGLKILEQEIPEQFLADGAHFELSPMYHCILLWDLLDLINLAKCSGNAELLTRLNFFKTYANKALQWLSAMVHPDQEVSFFNDSTQGIAAKPAEIFAYAKQLGLTLPVSEHQPLITMPASGYSRVTMPGHTLLFDHAAVGPDYLPGHAHADSLSLEWSVFQQRVLVNSGTSVYGISAERLRQRKTAAHNTVEVDGQDSSEVWSGFRVARRAYCKLLRAEQSADTVCLAAEHNGYMRLAGKVMHKRLLTVSTDELVVEDSLIGRWQQAKAFWHLHPDIKCKRLTDTTIELLLPNLQKLIVKTNAPIQLEDTSWHPGFGLSMPSNKLVIVFKQSRLITHFRLL